MIALFLLTLGTALLLQLMMSRNAHIDDHNRVTLLQGELTALRLRDKLTEGTNDPVGKLLGVAAGPEAGKAGRLMALADEKGTLLATLPAVENQRWHFRPPITTKVADVMALYSRIEIAQELELFLQGLGYRVQQSKLEVRWIFSPLLNLTKLRMENWII